MEIYLQIRAKDHIYEFCFPLEANRRAQIDGPLSVSAAQDLFAC